MKLAFGVGGVDWQERINFPRLRQERLIKTQEAMKKYGIAACLLTRPENIRYVTGIRGAGEFAPQLRYALAFAEDDPIMFELGDTLAHNKVHCTWIKPENWRYSFCWLGGVCGQDATRAEAKKWAAALVKELKKKGVDKEKLGVDAIDETGKQALSEAGIETAGVMPALREARRTKTQDEVNCIRMAIVIANAGFASLCETARPGLRECDLGGGDARPVEGWRRTCPCRRQVRP